MTRKESSWYQNLPDRKPFQLSKEEAAYTRWLEKELAEARAKVDRLERKVK